MKYIQVKNGDYVLYDETKITEAEAKKYENQESLDAGNFDGKFLLLESNTLKTELLPSVRRKNLTSSFSSQLSNKPKSPPSAPSGYTSFQTEFTLPDDKIPASYKAIGGKIEREQVVYTVSFDENGHAKYKNNATNTESNGITRGRQYEEENRIVIYDCVGQFSKADADIIQKVEKEYNQVKHLSIQDIETNLGSLFSPKEVNMFLTYLHHFSNTPEAKQGIENTIFHEIKHAETADYTNCFNLNPRSKTMSVENEVRSLEDDEKAATMQSVFNTINKYFKEGKNDLNIFNNYTNKHNILDHLKKELTSKSIDEINAFLKNPAQVAQFIAHSWDKDIATFYKQTGDTNNQFKKHIEDWAQKHPTHKIDDNDKPDAPDYVVRRKLTYVFDIYDPATGKTNRICLADAIPVPEISAEFAEQVIKPCKIKINKRKTNNKALYQTAQEINQNQWEQALIEDVKEEALIIGTYNPFQPLPEDPNITEDYQTDLDTFGKQFATSPNTIYSRDTTTKIYSAKIIDKDSGDALFIQANSPNNIRLGSTDKQGKNKIPDFDVFLAMAQKAKDQDAPIEFDKDIKDAEFKARLLAACIECGVETQNAPKKEELNGISTAMRAKLTSYDDGTSLPDPNSNANIVPSFPNQRYFDR